MATPLRHVLHAALTDVDARAHIARSPEDYLAEHGWGHLDAADLQEAMLILADGALTSEAITWVAGAETLDAYDGDATQALTVALAAMNPSLIAEDPATLDGFDGFDGFDGDTGDAPAAASFAGTVDADAPDDLDDQLALEGAALIDTSAAEADPQHAPIDEPGLIDGGLASGPFDEPDAVAHGIDRDDIGGSSAEPSSGQHQAPDDDWDGML